MGRNFVNTFQCVHLISSIKYNRKTPAMYYRHSVNVTHACTLTVSLTEKVLAVASQGWPGQKSRVEYQSD